MIYRKYEPKDKVLLCKEPGIGLYYQGYEWVQIRWLKYNQSTAEVPFAIGRDNGSLDESKVIVPFGFEGLRVATKEAGEKFFSSDELRFPPAKKTMKVNVEPFGGDIRVYQKVYKLRMNWFGGIDVDLTVKSDELAVGGAKPLTGTGYINVVQQEES